MKKPSITTGRPRGEFDAGLYAAFAGDKGTTEEADDGEKENRDMER